MPVDGELAAAEPLGQPGGRHGRPGRSAPRIGRDRGKSARHRGPAAAGPGAGRYGAGCARRSAAAPKPASLPPRTAVSGGTIPTISRPSSVISADTSVEVSSRPLPQLPLTRGSCSRNAPSEPLLSRPVLRRGRRRAAPPRWSSRTRRSSTWSRACCRRAGRTGPGCIGGVPWVTFAPGGGLNVNCVAAGTLEADRAEADRERRRVAAVPAEDLHPQRHRGLRVDRQPDLADQRAGVLRRQHQLVRAAAGDRGGRRGAHLRWSGRAP